MSSKNNKFYLKITNPDGLVFGGDALMFSSTNEKGNFDILPNHTNFISTINKHLKITMLDKKTKDIDFDTGVVRVENNIVDVYLGV